MLDKSLVYEILDTALASGADFAEVFVENSLSTSIQTGDRRVKNISSGQSFGIGIRVFKDLFSAYAYTNVMDRENLLKTAQKAAAALREKRQASVLDFVDVEIENKHKIKILHNSVNKSDKVSMMHKICETACGASSLVTKADATYLEKERQILVANSNGLWAEDKLSRGRFSLNVIAARDEKSQDSTDNFGGLYGFELFEGRDLQAFAEKTVSDAVSMLDAEDCPSGKMPVIIDNGFGGAIFHEACGHGLEATAVAKNASVFCGKLGQKVASELVTAYDDATIPNAWGSINIDDEGIAGQRKILIENGILKSYMVDSFNARRMGMEPNGCARRQNYKFMPTSRMSNTFIANGNSTLEEMIAATDYGVFAERMGGGSVNPASGEFNFSVNKAYVIEKGRLKQLVKGAKLIGSGIEILNNIDMVGNNMALACGMCGSASGSIPTTVGQPAIRVQNITVGGQK